MTRKWVLLIAMTLVTVVTWTLIELVSGFGADETSSEYKSHLTPLDSTFNEEALQEIITREEERLLVDRDVLE